MLGLTLMLSPMVYWGVEGAPLLLWPSLDTTGLVLLGADRVGQVRA